MENEIWRPIKDYEGLYEVSNLGRVSSLDRETIDTIGRKHYIKSRILKQGKDNHGYLVVALTKNGKSKTVRVHRLVAEAFIPNPENKPCIDHINTIRDDNRIENLRWATPKENMNNELTKDKFEGENNPFYGKHRTEETKKKISEAKKGKKVGLDNPKSIKLICIYPDGTQTDIMTRKELAEYLGISKMTVDKILKEGVYKAPKNFPELYKYNGIRIIKIER